MDNTSGRGDAVALPAEIRGWNWGGFLLTWVWWGFNGPKWLWFMVTLVLNMVLPLVSIVLSITLGLKGNEWAWRNRAWESVEHFKRVQRKWARWGFGIWLAIIAIPIAAVLWVVFNRDDANKKADAPPTITRAASTPAPKAPVVQPAGAPTANIPGSSESASSTANTSTTLQEKPGSAQTAAPAAARTTALDAEARAKAKEEQHSRRRTAIARELEAKRPLKATKSACVYKPVMTDEDIAKCR
jgi:hypothetical protein